MKTTKTITTAIVLISIIATTSLYAEYVISRPMQVYMQILCTTAWLAYLYVSIKFLGQRTDEVISENIDYIVMDKPLSEVNDEESDVHTPKVKKEKPKYKYRPRPKKVKTEGIEEMPKPKAKPKARVKPTSTDTPKTPGKRSQPAKRKMNNEDDNN